MTKRTKLIVGAVVVLGAYYLYSKNKTKREIEDLKSALDYPAPPPPLADSPTPKPDSVVSTDTPVLPKGGGSVVLPENQNNFSNFAGSRRNSISAQYFR
jgi:hypothetical protein